MKCPLCQNEQTIIARLAEDGRTETKNETEICENPDCSLYIDVSKLKNWVVKHRPKGKIK